MQECPQCRKPFDPLPTSGDFCPDCADAIRDEFGLSALLQRLWIRGVKPALARTRIVLEFAVHQLIGTWGVGLTAPFLVGFGFDFLRLFGRNYPMRHLHWILTETGYFPVQIGFALFLGWFLGRDLRRRLMFWVWVLPFAILCYAVAAVPTFSLVPISPALQAGFGQSRLWHYFGPGCQPERRCLDQIVVIMPFYAAAAYSIGALLAPRIPEDSRSASAIRFWAGLTIGLIFLAGAISILVEARQPQFQLFLRQSLPDGWWAWRWLLLPYGLLPAVVGAWLIDFAFRMRRKQETHATADVV
jgi:hypothetical protein